MAAFGYTAINAQGLELDGQIHAPDLASAHEQLRVRGLLARHPLVVRFFTAPAERGGWGATVAILQPDQPSSGTGRT